MSPHYNGSTDATKLLVRLEKLQIAYGIPDSVMLKVVPEIPKGKETL